MFSEITDLASRIIKRIEEEKQPLIYWLFSFVAFILFRMYLENFSTGTRGSRAFFDISNQIHLFLFFLVAFLLVAVVLAYFTKERIERIAKTIIVFSPIILVAPVIDLIITKGKGLLLSYIYDFSVQGFWIRFFTLGGTWQGGGATPGIKIEIIFVLVFIFIYIFIKTGRKILSFLGSAVFYCGLVTLAIFPLWLKSYYKIFSLTENVDYLASDSKVFLLLLFLLSTALYWRYKKENFQAVISELRITRIFFYLMLFFLGLTLSLTTFGVVKEMPVLILDTLLVSLAIILSSVFIMMINDREDVEIDKISSPKRILPAGQITESSYFAIGIACFIFALGLSATVSFEIFYLVLLGNLIYVLYSAPPFRLKRAFLFSKVLLGVVAVIVMTLGFLISHTGCSAFLPTPVLLSLFLAVFTGSHLIDLKDREGDRVADIKTLPVLVGDRNAKLIISFLFIASYLAITFLLGKGEYALFSLMLGLLVGISLFKKPYNEQFVFLMIYISLLYFSFLYLFL